MAQVVVVKARKDEHVENVLVTKAPFGTTTLSNFQIHIDLHRPYLPFCEIIIRDKRVVAKENNNVLITIFEREFQKIHCGGDITNHLITYPFYGHNQAIPGPIPLKTPWPFKLLVPFILLCLIRCTSFFLFSFPFQEICIF